MELKLYRTVFKYQLVFEIKYIPNRKEIEMARLTREQSRERTRATLIETARELLAEHGYDGCSIAEISDKAGFSKGAFFANFDSKEALLLELLRQDKAQEMQLLRNFITQSDKNNILPSILQDYIGKLNYNSQCVMLDIQMRLYASRHAEFSKEYDILQTEIRETLAELLALLLHKAGKQPHLPVSQLADIIIALIHGLNLQNADHLQSSLQFLFENIIHNTIEVSDVNIINPSSADRKT